jgi:CHAD domain-containing protein
MSYAADMTSRRRAALTRRAVALLARNPPAPIADVDVLLTDACAAALALEAERQHLRELIAELTARRRAYEQAAQTSPRRTA